MKAAGMKPSDIDEVLLVGGSTRIPAIQSVVKKNFGKHLRIARLLLLMVCLIHMKCLQELV